MDSGSCPWVLVGVSGGVGLGVDTSTDVSTRLTRVTRSGRPEQFPFVLLAPVSFPIPSTVLDGEGNPREHKRTVCL